MPNYSDYLGMDTQTQFDVNLDTQRTLDRAFTNLGNPGLPGTGLEQYLQSSGQVKSPNQNLSLPFTDALFSDNPEIAKTAGQYLKKNSQEEQLRNQYKTDFSIISTPKQAEKYIDKEFGYNPFINNDDFYYKNQYMTDGAIIRTGKNIGRFVGRVLGSAALKLTEGVAGVVALAGAGIEKAIDPNTDIWATVADNAVSKYLENAEEDFKNRDWMAVYHGVDYDKKGIFSKALDATFWTDSFADGAAFMVSALAPGMALSKLGLVSEAASFFGTATKAARFGNRVAEIATLGNKNWGEAGLWAYNTASESLLEGKQTYTESRDKLRELRAQGKDGYKNMTDAEISEKSGEKASNVFKANLAILSLSNAWENRMIFSMAGPGGSALSKKGTKEFASGISDIAEDFSVKAISKIKTGLSKIFDFSENARLGFYGEKIGAGILAEGLWEENAQLAVQRMQSKEHLYFDGADKDPSFLKNIGNFISQLNGQALAGDKDPEAAESIFLGAVLGAGSPVVIAKTFGGAKADGSMGVFKGERRQRIEATEAKIAAVNVAATKYKELLKDLYNADGSVNEAVFNLRKDKLSQEIHKQLSLEDMKNPEERKLLQRTVFSSYVLATLQAGKFDQVVGRLKDLANKSPEEITKLGFDPIAVKNENIDLIQYAEKGRDQWNTILKANISPAFASLKGYSPEELNVMDQHRRILAFGFYMRSIAGKDLLNDNISKNNELKKTILDALQSTTPGAKNNDALLTDHLVTLNSMPKQIANLEATLKYGVDKKSMPQYEIDARTKEIETLKAAYTEQEKTFKGIIDGINLEGAKIETIKNANGTYSIKDSNLVNQLSAALSQNIANLDMQAIIHYADLHYNALLDKEKGLENYKQYANLTSESVKTALAKYVPTTDEISQLTNLGHTKEDIEKFTKEQVAEIIKNKTVKKTAPAKNTTTTPVDPMEELDKQPVVGSNQPENPSYISSMWFSTNADATIKTLTQTYTTQQINENLQFEIVNNDGSLNPIVNFKTEKYMRVLTPPKTFIQVFTVINGQRVELGKLRETNMYQLYKKVGGKWVAFQTINTTFEEFQEIFNVSSSTTEAKKREDYENFKQRVANQNAIVAELRKPNADPKKVMQIVLSLGSREFTKDPLQNTTLEELEKSLPANSKVLAVIDNPSNEQPKIYQRDTVTDEEIDQASKLRESLIAKESNDLQVSLNKLGRYSVAVITPNGLTFIELKQLDIKPEELDVVFNLIKERSAVSVTENLNEEGKEIKKTFNNDFQEQVIDKIFITLNDSTLFGQGVNVEFELLPGGALSLNLSKRDSKGDLKNFKFGTTDKDLKIYVSGKELVDLNSMEGLLEVLNAKLKTADNILANAIEIKPSNFKLGTDKLFSFEDALKLNTNLGKLSFINPTVRVQALKNSVVPAQGNPNPAPVPAVPKFDFSQYKGKKFNIKRDNGTVVEVLVQTINGQGNIMVQFVPGTNVALYTPVKFLAALTTEPVTPTTNKSSTPFNPGTPASTATPGNPATKTSNTSIFGKYEPIFLNFMSQDAVDNFIADSSTKTIEELEQLWEIMGDGLNDFLSASNKLLVHPDLYYYMSDYTSQLSNDKAKSAQGKVFYKQAENLWNTIFEPISDQFNDLQTKDLNTRFINILKKVLIFAKYNQERNGGVATAAPIVIETLAPVATQNTAAPVVPIVQQVTPPVIVPSVPIVVIEPTVKAPILEVTPEMAANITLEKQDDDESPFKIVDASYTEQDEYDNDLFVEFMKNSLPDNIFTQKQIEKIGESLKNGNVKVGRFVATLKNVEEGIKGSIETTGNAFKYHEAFHGIYRLLLSTKEQQALQQIALKEVYAEQKSKGETFFKALERFKNEYPEKYGKLSETELRTLYVEEWIADRFEGYKNNPTTIEPKSAFARFFAKLLEMVKRLFNSDSDAFDSKNGINAFFKDIDRGVYKNRSVAENPFTLRLYEDGYGEVEVNKIKILKSINAETGKQTQGYLSDSDSSVAISTVLNAFLVDVTKEIYYNTNQLLDTIIDDLRDSIIEDRNNADPDTKERLNDFFYLYSIPESREALKEEVDKILQYVGYSQGLLSDEIEEYEDDEGSRKGVDHFSDSENFGGFKSLSKEIREYLATISTSYSMFNGRTETRGGRLLYKQIFIPFVYNGILKATAGVTTDVEFLEKLRQFSKYNENTLIFTKKFFQSIFDPSTVADPDDINSYKFDDLKSRIKNTSLFQAFRKGFETMSMTYKMAGIDINKNEAQMINLNTKNSAKLQFQKWANSYIAKKASEVNQNRFVSFASARITKLLNALKKTDYTSAQILIDSEELSNQIMIASGMKFHPLYIRLSLLSKLDESLLSEDDLEVMRLYNDVIPLTEEDLGYISETIKLGQNPFLSFFDESITEDGDTVNLTKTGAKTRLLNMAIENAKLDEFVWDSVFINAENKKVWTHQTHTYNSVALKEIQKGNNKLPIGQSQLYDNPTFKLILPFITLFRQGGLSTVTLTKEGENSVVNDSLQSNKAGGVTYGGLDTRSLYISLFSSYFDSRVIKGVTVSPHLTRILESSNTGDMVELAVNDTLNNGQLSDDVMNMFLNELYKEGENVKTVFSQLLGKVADYEEIKGYNDKALVPGELRDDIEDGPKGRVRGTKLFAFTEILGKTMAEKLENKIRSVVEGDLGGDLFEAQDLQEIKDRINNYFFNPQQGLIEGVLKDLKEEGLIKINNKNEFENKFLPGDFFGKVSAANKSKIKGLHIQTEGENIFRNNVSQFVINDFLNTLMYNNMIFTNQNEYFKDPVDIIKRAKGINAGGVSIYSELIDKELGIFHPTTKFDLYVKPTDEYFSELKNDSQDRSDAQSMITEKMFRHIMFALGRLDLNTSQIYDKIMSGEETTADIFGKSGLISFNRQTNVLKLVYFDGKTGTYIKTSSYVLTKKLTSFKKADGTWEALPNRKKLHQLREEMEELEGSKLAPEDGKLVWVATSSASKMRTVLGKNGPFEDLLNNQKTAQKGLSTKFLRLQTENPSNKSKGIFDPTQEKHIVDTEQDKNSDAIKQLQKDYQKNSKQRLLVNYLFGRNSIFDFIGEEDVKQRLIHEIDLSIKQNQISPKLEKFRKIAVQTLKNSGGSSQTIEFFEQNFELNSPFIREKFEDLISAFFTKYGFKERIPGHAFTLASDVGMKVIKQAQIREVDGKRIVKWFVIPTSNVASAMEKGSTAFRNLPEYSTPTKANKNLGKFRQDFIDTLQDGDLFIDELQHNVPVYNEKGEIIEHYTEVIIPPHHKQIEELIRLGHSITPEMLKMFSVRIPSQDKHSALSVRVVDFAPAHLGSTLWGAKELIEISGADFDVDKVFSQMMDMYFTNSKEKYVDKKGKEKTRNVPVVHAYGEAKNKQERFAEYVEWNFTNNALLKDEIKRLKAEHATFNKLQLEKQKLYKENRIISEQFKIKIDDSWKRYQDEKVLNKTVDNVDIDGIIETIANIEEQLLTETKFKRMASLKYMLAEQKKLLAEADVLSLDEEDESPLEENTRYVAERKEILAPILERLEVIRKELYDISKGIKEEAAKTYNIAATEDELELLNEKGEQNIGVLNNLLLQNKIELQSNKYVVDNGLDTEPATLSIFLEFQQDEYFKKVLRKDVAFFPDHMLGKIKHQKSNKEGQENIGPAVNTMLVYSLFHKYGVKLSAGNEIRINGVDYSTYANTRTDSPKKTRIFNMISQVITAMTDNAKERIAYKHNLTIDSIPVFVHMVALGIDEKLAQALFLHPSVFEYYAEIRENKLAVKDLAALKSKKDIREGLLTKYPAKERQGFDYDTETMYESLNYPLNPNTESYMLKLLFQLEDQIAPFNDVLSLVKLPKGLYNGMTTFRNIDESLTALQLQEPITTRSLFDDENEPIAWEGIDAAFEQHYTGQMINQAKELGVMSKQISIPLTNIFEKLMRSVYKQADVKNYNKEIFYKNLINDFLSFLSASVYMKMKEGKPVHGLLNSSVLVGENSLGMLLPLAEQQYKVIYPGQESALLGEYLTISPVMLTQTVNGQEVQVENSANKSGFDVVKSNTFTNIDENESLKLQNEYENMLNSGDPILIKTAMAIYAYAIVKDGHMFKSGGLLQILPTRVLKEFMNTLTLVKDIFVKNEGVQDLKKLNKDSGELFKQHFGDSFLSLTRKFSQMYFENFNNRDSVKKVNGLKDDSLTVTKIPGGFTIDLFKGVKNREITADEEYVMKNHGLKPSEFPPNFFKTEFGKRLSELKEKGFQIYAVEENGKKRWKISLPLVVRTIYRTQTESSTTYYRLKTINPNQSTVFENYYSDDFNILSEIGEYEAFELKGGYNLSSISEMFGELPQSIKKKTKQALSEDADNRLNAYLENDAINQGFASESDFSENNPIESDLISRMFKASGKPAANGPVNIYAGTNENAILSNFAIRPFETLSEEEGINGYNSVEEAFQIAKFEYSDQTDENRDVVSNIKNAKTGAQIKALGKTFKGFDTAAWDINSSRIMKEFLMLSFQQNDGALDALLATGNKELTHTQDKSKWGKEFPRILMEVRTELRVAEPVNNLKTPEFNKLPEKSDVQTFTYAGIGSRETPAASLSIMTELAKELESKGYTLNTGITFGGKEEGADKAFSDGTDKKNLFSPEEHGSRALEQKIAKEMHPAPAALKAGGLKLMARNTNQIFGNDLKVPVDFVIFYAQETSNPLRPKGGTGQAVEMARLKRIPTINLADNNWREQLDNALNNKPADPIKTSPVKPVQGSLFDPPVIPLTKDDLC